MCGKIFRCVALLTCVFVICFTAYSSEAERWDVNVWKNSAEIEIFGKEKIHPGDSHTYTMKLMNPRDFYVSFDIYAKAVLTVDGKTDTTTRLPMNITFSNPGADGIKRNISDLFTTDDLGIHVGHGELTRYNRAYIDVKWEWPFHVSAETDRLDTSLSRHDTRLKVIITTVSEADPAPGPDADAVIDLVDGDEFVIYDADNVPQSYYLTEFIHRGSDLSLNASETREAFEHRARRYRSENPDIFMFESLPDMRTDDNGAEVPVTNEKGGAVFGERKMMLSGLQLKKLLELGIDEIIFKNGDTALRFAPKSLLGSLMVPAYRKLESNMREHVQADANAADIVSEKNTGRQLKSLFQAVQVSGDAGYDGADDVSVFDLTIFPNSVFEFTIIPFHADKLLSLAVRGSLSGNARQAVAAKMTDDELSLLYGLLKREKIFNGSVEDLRDTLKDDGLMSDKRFAELAEKYGSYPACLIKCRLIYGDVYTDISDLINAELITETEYEELKKVTKAPRELRRGLELKQWSYIRFNSGSLADEGYEKEETGNHLPAVYDEIGPNRDSEFCDISAGKAYPRLEVRVRRDPEDPNKSIAARSFASVGFETRPYLRCDGRPDGIYVVAQN